MPYKIDYLEDAVLEWTLTDDGAIATEVADYTPTLYASTTAPDRAPLANLHEFLTRLPHVSHVEQELKRVGFRHEAEPVLRIDVTDLDALTEVARLIRDRDRPGTHRCFNVDFSREFRYCLERDCSPVPDVEPTTLSIDIPPTELALDSPTRIIVDGEELRTENDPETLLEAFTHRLEDHDPDVLILSSATVVPTLFDLAARCDFDLKLGRLPGYQQLAGRSTYTSYGRVGHSPARYNVPGRAIIDTSNTFFYRQSGLDGCLDMVGRSGKPLQEVAWASIGNVLTAIQIHEALRRDVLVPWKAWRPEFFKTMSQLQTADRGGFTFAPDVGMHDDVHELDFSSMYPNIICQHNISPETVRCDCHSGREDVPEIGYTICDEPGYLPDVLQPLINARDEIKARIRETDDVEERATLKSRSSAIKWILVSCFGYQGFSNAKFGRIRCHESINAFARQLLLETKEALEEGGWRVVHGIVDSVWVTPNEDVPDGERRSLEEIASEITERAGIRLEYEAAYEWISFVPQRNSEAGALTKYFGKQVGEDEYKYRGIECRQRSTPSFVEETQYDLIETLAEHRTPEAVCDRLQRSLSRLRTGDIDVEKLAIRQRASKQVEEYTQYTRTVAALERGESEGIDIYPGESVSYVVVDDDKQSRERVRLTHELDASDAYDATFYETLLIRATESVVSSLGWREADIRDYLAAQTDSSLAAFSD